MVHVKGATGLYAAEINGLYEPTTEFVNYVSVYRKVGDADKWIEYVDGQWLILDTEFRGKSLGWASARVYPAVALEECPMDIWEVYDGDDWEAQPSLSVSVSSLEAFEEFELTQVVHIFHTCHACMILIPRHEYSILKL